MDFSELEQLKRLLALLQEDSPTPTGVAAITLSQHARGNQKGYRMRRGIQLAAVGVVLLCAVVGTGEAQTAISTDGVVESTTGGFKFPDGSVQTTAVVTFYERDIVSAADNDEETARGAANEVPLFSSGPFEVYGKCFEDLDDDKVYAAAYVRTSKDRSLLDAVHADSALSGGTAGLFFNTDTYEGNRQIGVDNLAQGGRGSYFGQAGIFFTNAHAISPDGESLLMWVNTASKNGPLTGGDGPYLPGDSCIWQGYYIATS